MDILSTVADKLKDPTVMEQLGKKAGARPDQVGKLAQNALPLLLKTMQQNASTPEGAKSLEKALRDHQDDPVEDVFNLLQGVDIEDGAKILGHIFSSKKEQVQKDLAGKTGLTVEQVVAVLTQLAPLVLGALGNEKKKKEKEKSSAGDLGDLLGGLLGSLLK